MILRKPYAFFIKYFKVLHMIMAVLAAIVLYGVIRLYSFFSAYSIDYRSATNNFSASNYLNTFSYVFVILSLILTVICLSVAIYKSKPKKLYIYNVAVLGLILLLYYLIGPNLREMDSTIVDVRIAKAFRDFLLLSVLLEVVSFVMIIVRATGFDIKQFDFVSDLQKLDISDEDSEEIEVALEFDPDEFKRKLKAYLRDIKYTYFENKFVANILLAVLAVIIGFFIYSNVGIYTDNYSCGKSFTASGVTLNVKDSYILDSTADGTKMVETTGDNAGAIVIVRLQIKGYTTNQKFNTGIVNLKIGKYSYGQNTAIATKIADLGTPYISQKLTSEYETYTLAFEIPLKRVHKKMYLKINDDNSNVKGKIGAKNVLVRLKPIDLRKEGKVFEQGIGETVNFDDSILGSSSMVINSFEINDKFRLDYNYCYGVDKCMASYEFVTPTTTGRYFKTLMKVSGNVVIDSTTNIGSINDFRTLFNEYGYINYLVDDVWQTKKIDSAVIKPNAASLKDTLIEVPYDVKKASQINLTLKIRNQNYKYTLKW